jgi:hypothetical protein
MATVNEAGAKGGSAKSDRKKASSRANALRAREAKLAYRLNPSLRQPKPPTNSKGEAHGN